MPSKIDKMKLNREQDRRARFTNDQVKEMKSMYAKGYSQHVIAEIFGTRQSTVSYIVSKKAQETLAKYRKNNPPKRRTTEEQRLYQRDLRAYKRTLIEKESLTELKEGVAI